VNKQNVGQQFQQESLGPDFDNFVEEQRKWHESRAEPDVPEGHTLTANVSDRAVPGIIKHGGIVNTFHPDAAPGKGHFYNEFRTSVEDRLFGDKVGDSWESRPVYGYLRKGDDHLDAYGDVAFDVAPPRGTEVTTTAGDSFVDGITAERLNKNHTALDTRSGNYRELQFHSKGPLPVSRAVVRRGFFAADADHTAQQLREAGIPTTTASYIEHQPTLDRSMFGDGDYGWHNDHGKPLPARAEDHNVGQQFTDRTLVGAGAVL